MTTQQPFQTNSKRRSIRLFSYALSATLMTCSLSSCKLSVYLTNLPDNTGNATTQPTTPKIADIYSLNDATGVVNGHPFVDLGLPSGTLWATTNIGAMMPFDFGELIAWGELHEKREFSWRSYRLADDMGNMTMYNYDDRETILLPEMDAATQKWGRDWRMASRNEMEELIRYCKVRWVVVNGHYGALFTGPNGKNIFLPGSGCTSSDARHVGGNHCDYWSCSRGSNTRPEWAGYLFVGKEGQEVKFYENDRYIGRSIRPVLIDKRGR